MHAPAPKIETSAFSKLAQFCARSLWISRPNGRMNENVLKQAIQESCENLVALGFPAHLVNAPFFRVFPDEKLWAWMDAKASKLKLDLGAKSVGTTIDGNGERKAVSLWTRSRAELYQKDDPSCTWTQIATIDRSGGISRFDDYYLIALGDRLPDYLDSKGLDAAKWLKMIIGHEIGHALFRSSGILHGLHELLCRCEDFGMPSGMQEEIIAKAQELYCDQVGCLCTLDFKGVSSLVNRERVVGFLSDGGRNHISDAAIRENVSAKTRKMMAVYGFCAPEIAVECLAAAFEAAPLMNAGTYSNSEIARQIRESFSDELRRMLGTSMKTAIPHKKTGF